MRKLSLDQQMLLSVFGQEPPLGLDDDAVGEDEVWSIGGVTERNLIFDLRFFEPILDTEFF